MKVAGSVSGGCIEGAVIEEALEVLETGQPRQLNYGVEDDLALSVGLSCGGEVSVLVEKHWAFSNDQETGKVQSFSKEMQDQVESLASQGAVALTNKRLVAELKNLFESFIQLIATAIDKKSPYTGGHCERVPEIAMLLANAVEKTTEGKYKDFSMTEDERYELFIAGWLHD